MNLFFNIVVCTLISWLLVHIVVPTGLDLKLALISFVTTVILQSLIKVLFHDR